MTAGQHALEDLTPHQLVSEIQEILVQYRVEVSTKRRTWPASIRDRIVALRKQGVSPYRISELSGVPYTTVVSWFGRPKPKSKERGRFLPVVQGGIRPAPSTDSRVTTVRPTMVAQTTVVGLTVVLPGGFEVRGLSNLEQIAELYRSIGAGGRA
jgi:hypothetical protein